MKQKINIRLVAISLLAILTTMIGITYVAQFASEICKDAGYGAVGTQIEMFGKLSILAMSLPVLTTLLTVIEEFAAQ